MLKEVEDFEKEAAEKKLELEKQKMLLILACENEK